MLVKILTTPFCRVPSYAKVNTNSTLLSPKNVTHTIMQMNFKKPPEMPSSPSTHPNSNTQVTNSIRATLPLSKLSTEHLFPNASLLFHLKVQLLPSEPTRKVQSLQACLRQSLFFSEATSLSRSLIKKISNWCYKHSHRNRKLHHSFVCLSNASWSQSYFSQNDRLWSSWTQRANNLRIL